MKRWYIVCSLCILVLMAVWGTSEFISWNQKYDLQNQGGESFSANVGQASEAASEDEADLVFQNENPEMTASDEEDGEEQSSEENYEYYMCLHNGTICVYYSDKTTLWMDTQISENEINQDAYEKLQDGVMVKSIWDVYSYLESYTS